MQRHPVGVHRVLAFRDASVRCQDQKCDADPIGDAQAKDDFEEICEGGVHARARGIVTKVSQRSSYGRTALANKVAAKSGSVSSCGLLTQTGQATGWKPVVRKGGGGVAYALACAASRSRCPARAHSQCFPAVATAESGLSRLRRTGSENLWQAVLVASDRNVRPVIFGSDQESHSFAERAKRQQQLLAIDVPYLNGVTETRCGHFVPLGRDG